MRCFLCLAAIPAPSPLSSGCVLRFSTFPVSYQLDARQHYPLRARMCVCACMLNIFIIHTHIIYIFYMCRYILGASHHINGKHYAYFSDSGAALFAVAFTHSFLTFFLHKLPALFPFSLSGTKWVFSSFVHRSSMSMCMAYNKFYHTRTHARIHSLMK